MASQNRRSSLTTSSSLAKRHASSSSLENPGKITSGVPPAAKKRPVLANITNQRQGSSRTNVYTSKIGNTKKIPSSGVNKPGFSSTALPASSFVKPCSTVSNKTGSFSSNEVSFTRANGPGPVTRSSSARSAVESDALSVSMDESMSTCDSLKSPDVEYIDDSDMVDLDSLERKTCCKLNISDNVQKIVTKCQRDVIDDMDTDEKIVDVDNNFVDPQLCATIACDIYKHLRASEAKKRPSPDFMETVQKDINTSMRAILVDWLVEVAEEYRLVPDTLYLTVNYIDRYLSGNMVDRQRLQLLGVACMMIASKYEEICAPQVEEFCYITDNTYFKDEVLQMETTVLNFLKFEMTAPTAKCFLRRFIRAAQGVNEAPSMQLECLANYIAELSLLEYSMLHYAPSLIAASSIFLARYVLFPSRRPWNATLRHYTLYQPIDLRECVKALHALCLDSHSSSLPAVREKYSQHKYKFVGKKSCPESIPTDYFEDVM